MLQSHLTKLQVVSGELPLLIVGQLGGVDEGVIVALIALNDLPAYLVFGLLLVLVKKHQEEQKQEGHDGHTGSQHWSEEGLIRGLQAGS